MQRSRQGASHSAQWKRTAITDLLAAFHAQPSAPGASQRPIRARNKSFPSAPCSFSFQRATRRVRSPDPRNRKFGGTPFPPRTLLSRSLTESPSSGAVLLASADHSLGIIRTLWVYPPPPLRQLKAKHIFVSRLHYPPPSPSIPLRTDSHDRIRQ